MNFKISAMKNNMVEYPVLFFDGECALCNGAVRFIMRHEKSKIIKFASLQSDFAQQQLKTHFGTAVIPNSLILSENNNLFVRSDAVFRIISYLNKGWKLFYAFKIFPTNWLDWFYDIVARNRKHVFGTSVSCELIPGVDQSRFIT